MATTIFNAIILAAARRAGDARTDASATGDAGRRFTSAIWAEYGNQSVRDLLTEKLGAMGVDAFADAFPEYVKSSAVLTLVAGAVAKPSDAWLFVELAKSDGTVMLDRVDGSRVHQVRSGRDPLQVPSVTEPVYWEENGSLNVLPAAAAAWQVQGRYVVTPTDVVVVTGAGGTDLPLNARWHGELKDRMVAYAMKDAKLVGGPESVSTVPVA